MALHDSDTFYYFSLMTGSFGDKNLSSGQLQQVLYTNRLILE